MHPHFSEYIRLRMAHEEAAERKAEWLVQSYNILKLTRTLNIRRCETCDRGVHFSTVFISNGVPLLEVRDTKALLGPFLANAKGLG